MQTSSTPEQVETDQVSTLNKQMRSIDIDKLARNYPHSDNIRTGSSTSLHIDKMNEELVSSIKATKENQVDKINDRYP